MIYASKIECSPSSWAKVEMAMWKRDRRSLDEHFYDLTRCSIVFLRIKLENKLELYELRCYMGITRATGRNANTCVCSATGYFHFIFRQIISLLVSYTMKKLISFFCSLCQDILTYFHLNPLTGCLLIQKSD